MDESSAERSCFITERKAADWYHKEWGQTVLDCDASLFRNLRQPNRIIAKSHALHVTWVKNGTDLH